MLDVRLAAIHFDPWINQQPLHSTPLRNTEQHMLVPHYVSPYHLLHTTGAFQYGLVMRKMEILIYSTRESNRYFSIPEDFMDSHEKVSVADQLDIIASTTWCGAVYQWRIFPQPRSRRVFSDLMERDPTDVH